MKDIKKNNIKKTPKNENNEKSKKIIDKNIQNNNNNNSISIITKSNNKKLKKNNKKKNSDIINSDNNGQNLELIYTYDNLKLKPPRIINYDENIYFVESFPETKAIGRKKIICDENDDETENISKKSRTTATFCNNLNDDIDDNDIK